MTTHLLIPSSVAEDENKDVRISSARIFLLLVFHA
jgi:hypothetical protein